MAQGTITPTAFAFSKLRLGDEIRAYLYEKAPNPRPYGYRRVPKERIDGTVTFHKVVLDDEEGGPFLILVLTNEDKRRAIVLHPDDEASFAAAGRQNRELFHMAKDQLRDLIQFSEGTQP